MCEYDHTRAEKARAFVQLGCCAAKLLTVSVRPANHTPHAPVLRALKIQQCRTPGGALNCLPKRIRNGSNARVRVSDQRARWETDFASMLGASAAASSMQWRCPLQFFASDDRRESRRESPVRRQNLFARSACPVDIGRKHEIWTPKPQRSAIFLGRAAAAAKTFFSVCALYTYATFLPR